MDTVLVIDDDPLLLRMLEHRLSVNNFKVETAADGGEGLRAVGEVRPDVIVLDAMMPVLNGFEVLRGLKEHPEMKSIPVLMLTARKKENDVLQGLSLGAADYLVKPFAPEELVSRIRRVLKASRLARATG